MKGLRNTSGKWQVASCKWQVASGKWQVESGKWQVGEPSDGTNFGGNEILNHSLGFAGEK